MNIDKEKIAKQAEEFGFTAVWFPVSEIPTNPEYLKYCEVNRCGNYGANYACPPDCGTPDEMRARLDSAREALVLQSLWEVPGYGTPEVLTSKAEHGAAAHNGNGAASHSCTASSHSAAAQIGQAGAGQSGAI